MSVKKEIYANEESSLLDILMILCKLLFLLMIVSIFLMLIFFSQSRNFFLIKDFKVSGAVNSNVEDLNLILKKYVGKSLLNTEIDKISEEISSCPWYENVIVTKSFPDRLRIFLKERKPYAVALISGKPFLVSEDGMILSKFTKKYKWLIDEKPLITGISQLDDEGVVKKKIGFYKKFVEGLKKDKCSNFLSKISEVIVDNSKNLVVVVDKIEVELGKSGFNEKVKSFFLHKDEIEKKWGKNIRITMMSSSSFTVRLRMKSSEKKVIKEGF